MALPCPPPPLPPLPLLPWLELPAAAPRLWLAAEVCFSFLFVVPTSSLLINSLFHSVIWWSFSSKSPKYLHSKTVRARELKFLRERTPPTTFTLSHVTCPGSCVMCHMSCFICHMSHLNKNIARLQNAAQSTSHRLSRCQVVLTKRLFKVLSDIDLSEFEFFSCQNLSFEFCQSLSFGFLTNWVLSQFDFFSCHIFSFWVWQKFEFLSCQIFIFEFCHNLSFKLYQFEFLSFVKIFVFEFCHNLSLTFITIWFEFYHKLILLVLLLLTFFNFLAFWVFVTIWDFEFCHNLSIFILSQFEFLSFVAIWVKFCHH